MNDYLLIYFIGVILSIILSLIIGLKELREEYIYHKPHTLKYINWNDFVYGLICSFIFSCVLSIFGCLILLLHLFGFISIQRK